MAASAPPATGGGTGMSQTPCARVMPPTRSHSTVMLRISALAMRAARLLRDSGTSDLPMSGHDFSTPQLPLNAQLRNCQNTHGKKRKGSEVLGVPVAWAFIGSCGVAELRGSRAPGEC